jgi:hypothetical protein
MDCPDALFGETSANGTLWRTEQAFQIAWIAGSCAQPTSN